MCGGGGILPNTGMYVPVPYNLVLKTSVIEESWAESFLLKILLRLNVVFTVRIQLGTVSYCPVVRLFGSTAVQK